MGAALFPPAFSNDMDRNNMSGRDVHLKGAHARTEFPLKEKETGDLTIMVETPRQLQQVQV
jgi:hypothetical protein